MTRGNANRQLSLAHLNSRSSQRPVGIHDVLAALVDSLSSVYDFGEREHTLAYLILFGRNSHSISLALACSEARAVEEIAALFERTDTRSREELFHLALRLANTTVNWRSAPSTPPPPPRTAVRSRGWSGNAELGCSPSKSASPLLGGH